jgi:glycosyltransferase involved in cell wall biosynthesis
VAEVSGVQLDAQRRHGKTLNVTSPNPDAAAAPQVVRTNVHIYPAVFQHESRILKETRSIIDAGLADRIIILANHQAGFPEEETIDANRTVIRLRLFFLRFRKNLLTEILAYTETLFKTVWVLRRVNVEFVNPHSLSVLPAAVMLRIFKGAKVIYDAHELETERWGLSGARKFVSRLMEKTLMPFVSKVIVVGPSIAEWYRNEYRGKPVYVIRNIPHVATQEDRDPTLLRKAIDAPDDAIVFLYQGLYAEGRGIEMMLEAFSGTSNANAHCVFMGKGPLEPLIAETAAKAANIHLVPPVDPDQVLAYSCGADIGLCIIEDCCLSYRYSLPNKFFEYITAGLPLVVFPCPDQVEIISRHANGWVVDESAAALVKFLDELSQGEFQVKKKNADASKTEFDWDTDAAQYAEIFA